MIALVLALGLLTVGLALFAHLLWHSREEARRQAANARVLAEVYEIERDKPTPPQAA
jgi:hypothetical protein